MRRPNPGRILASGRERLRGGLGAISGAVRSPARAMGRGIRGLGRAIAGLWAGLSVPTRRRLGAALAVAVALLLLLGLAVPNLPCELPGGDSCPPADDAEELVPADALAYVHVNLDPDSEQYELAADVARRVPVISGQVAARALAQVPGAARTGPAFERDVRPWFAGELGVAFVGGTGRAAKQVELLEVEDADRARRFAATITAAGAAAENYRGIELTVDRRGLATAQLEGFLAIGSPDGVRAAIDAATGADGAEALADDEAATELRDGLPDHRLAEAYVSEDGIAALIEGAPGTLGSLTPLIGPGASRGAAAALVATEDGLELSVRSALDPDRAESEPGFFAAFPDFEPVLPERLAADSLGYVGVGEPRETIRALLAQASAQAPAIAAGFEDLVRGLRRESSIDIGRQLLAALGGEAALTLAPRPGAAAEVALPYLEFVAADVDEDAARRTLAALQASLAEAAKPDSDLQAPVFGQERIGGVESRSLRISPTVELTYAVFDGLAAVATAPAGIAELAKGDGGLDEDELYRRVTDGLEDEVSVLAYLDLGGLVEIGERLGLAEDPLYATFAGEFRRLEALGLAVDANEELISTELRLLVSEAEPVTEGLEEVAPPAD